MGNVTTQGLGSLVYPPYDVAPWYLYPVVPYYQYYAPPGIQYYAPAITLKVDTETEELRESVDLLGDEIRDLADEVKALRKELARARKSS